AGWKFSENTAMQKSRASAARKSALGSDADSRCTGTPLPISPPIRLRAMLPPPMKAMRAGLPVWESEAILEICANRMSLQAYQAWLTRFRTAVAVRRERTAMLAYASRVTPRDARPCQYARMQRRSADRN